jgi:peptidase E
MITKISSFVEGNKMQVVGGSSTKQLLKQLVEYNSVNKGGSAN